MYFSFPFSYKSTSCKYKLHMQLKPFFNHLCNYKFFTKCHEGHLYLKLQKWLIWTKFANAWLRMDMIPCNESCTRLKQ